METARKKSVLKVELEKKKKAIRTLRTPSFPWKLRKDARICDYQPKVKAGDHSNTMMHTLQLY